MKGRQEEVQVGEQFSFSKTTFKLELDSKDAITAV